jgi:hypothetical protein
MMVPPALVVVIGTTTPVTPSESRFGSYGALAPS